MVVASGQMPYDYGAPLPVRALRNAWPGIGTPNIAASGDLIEAAMFVYNAELRKWGLEQLDLLQYNLYTHPDVAASGFEPKARGETLTGLVAGKVGLLAVDNIEQMRLQLLTFLFDLYSDDSNYGSSDFLQAWVQTAYPESPSGTLRIHEVLPNIFVLDGRTFLRPAAEHITGGDFIDTDLHWLGGSGVFFDIDVGEVIFNPFPFPDSSNYFAPSTGNHRFNFGPVIPVIQTTVGGLPSVDPTRYQTDIGLGTFKALTNFNAIASGYVQIDGYVLLSGSTMELVKGNDFNVEGTVTNVDDYTGHIQGLRRVADGAGKNDPSARCYRLPTVQASGLYRFLVHNRRANVPLTAIPSGFVSLFPQGQVIKSDTGDLILSNFIDGRQLIEASDGTMILRPELAKGIHVLDDAIWVTSPNNADTPSGNFHSAGLFVLSPWNGDLVWYRPAERILSTSGNYGPGPAIFGAHVGLMDIGTDFVRVSKTALQIFESNVLGNEDLSTFTIYFQRYDKTTLDHTEVPVGYSIQSEDSLTGNFSDAATGLTAALSDGTDVFVCSEFGTVHRFNSSLAFQTAYRGPIARRRYFANGQYLYSIGGNVQVGDPLLSIAGGLGSGIGVWSRTEPAGTPVDMVGIITHDSGKPLRGEAHFGHQTNARIHHIFDVTGSTHVRDGTWMLIQFDTRLHLCRIVEQASQWLVVESMRFIDTFDTIPAGGLPLEFPIEGVLHDID